MLVIMLSLGCNNSADTPTEATPTGAAPVEAMPVEAAMYVCPMHPDITSDKAGSCSECGMDLVKQESHDHGSHEHGDDTKKSLDEHHGH